MGGQFPQAPATPYGRLPGEKPSNFLPWSIAVTLLCCLPFGIVAIVYASQVDSKWFAGDYRGAHQAAKNARTWTYVSAGVGLFIGIAYVAIVVLGVAASTPTGY